MQTEIHVKLIPSLLLLELAFLAKVASSLLGWKRYSLVQVQKKGLQKSSI
jgi:hypothetical protein